MSKLSIKNIRYFNNINIVDGGKNVIKSYIGDDKYYKEKFYDEIIWMIKAQEAIKDYTPKVVDYSLDKSNLWIKYNFIELNTVHDFFINDKKLNWDNLRIAYEKFIDVCKKIKPKTFIKDEWNNKLINFYLERTHGNLLKIKNKKKLRGFFYYDFVYINNKKYPSLKLILDYLKNKINQLKKKSLDENHVLYKLCEASKDRIFLTHLDLIFGNTFFDEEKQTIIVIDPRGSFADSKDYGDIYYDYAKIYQSIYGLYDFIVEDRFEIEKEDENIFFVEINQPKNIEKIQKSFSSIFPKENLDVIKLLEALQFFAMTPAHEDSINRQIIQICTGIKHFTEILGNEIWER